MIFTLIEPKSVAEMRREHYYHTVSHVDRRLREGSGKQDIWNLILESDVLTQNEMYSNAELFMTAGTETIST